MTDSVRKSLISAIDTRFKSILIDDDNPFYRSNLGLHVFDWEDRELADSELEALIYRDRTNDITAFTMRECLNGLRLEIEIRTRKATGTAAALRDMIQDVYAAIGKDDTWGQLAINSEPLSEEMEVRHDDKITGKAKLIIEIQYQAEKWKY